MPLILSDIYKRKDFTHKIRINLLMSNRLEVLANTLNKQEIRVDKLKAITKRTVLESMIVPSCKTIFKKSESVDPFLAALRQKATK